MATKYVRKDGNNANDGSADDAAHAWLTVKYAMQNASNGVIADGDLIYLQASQTWTENAIANDRGVLLDMRGGTLDGTGGAAGSDNFTSLGNSGSGAATIIRNGTLANAVDRGVTPNGNANNTAQNVLIQAPGTIGFAVSGTGTHVLIGCAVRAAGSNGHSIQATLGRLKLFFCEFSDCAGFGAGIGIDTICCVAYDNVGRGFDTTGVTAAAQVNFVGCTIEGNGTDNVGPTTPFVTSGLIRGASFVNCSLTNAGDKAIDFSAAPTELDLWADYNLYFGNANGNANFLAGSHDLSSDPQYVDAPGDNLTPKSTSPLIRAGVSRFKSPMAINIGAIAHLAAGGSPLIGGGLVR